MPQASGRRRPDTESVGGGHDALRHLGSLKPPVYETSTFVFANAAEGKRFFEGAYGPEVSAPGYIYSRLDSPNLAPVEARLAAWEEAEDTAIFASGMGAITSVLLTFLKPGQLVLYSMPTYGGTATLMKGLLSEFGVVTRSFRASAPPDEIEKLIGDDHLVMIYIETPANPTNDLVDIGTIAELGSRYDARVVVDNTFLSPVWQRPLLHGADLTLHSATKYLGGHSDLTAGAVCGGVDDVAALRRTRYEVGTTPSPGTAWLLGRSLETLRLRVEKQTENATVLAGWLRDHPKVSRVSHLSLLEPGDPGYDIYKRQCLGPGAMISFEIAGEEEECFRFLDSMNVVRLATSLGGTESLASHPWTMSPPSASQADKLEIGVTPGLIRFSVGIEDVADLLDDLEQALDQV